MKDVVKSSISNSFKQAFEHNLAPAFQVGVNNMFSQIQSAVDSGMANVIEEAKKVFEVNQHYQEGLESEVIFNLFTRVFVYFLN